MRSWNRANTTTVPEVATPVGQPSVREIADTSTPGRSRLNQFSGSTLAIRLYAPKPATDVPVILRLQEQEYQLPRSQFHPATPSNAAVVEPMNSPICTVTWSPFLAGYAIFQVTDRPGSTAADGDPPTLSS